MPLCTSCQIDSVKSNFISRQRFTHTNNTCHKCFYLFWNSHSVLIISQFLTFLKLISLRIISDVLNAKSIESKQISQACNHKQDAINNCHKYFCLFWNSHSVILIRQFRTFLKSISLRSISGVLHNQSIVPNQIL